MRYLFKSVFTLGIGLRILLNIQLPAYANVVRKNFVSEDQKNSLLVEILDDDLIHFEYATTDNASRESEPLDNSPMVFKTDYSGPTQVSSNNNIIETKDIKLEVVKTDRSDLCLKFNDKTKQNVQLTIICPVDLSANFKGIDIEPGQIENVYGLGQELKGPGSADGDWTNLRVRQGLSRPLDGSLQKRQRVHGAICGIN